MKDTTGTEPFDMSLVQCGARLRRSPFYEAEQRYGPKGYTVYNHMLFPIRYDDLEVSVLLAPKRTKYRLQRIFAVVRGDDDGDQSVHRFRPFSQAFM